ncbi:hypothetical protein LEM8419_01941 [Neolewinella maritima]|uniref:Cytochrome C Planctomycete-type domain-containing protein n=1 Tax=Neolewinella maritima TaxID=1383882 RepID=A0ABN8F704_9BACT|nr:c-type cytochrome domain-containing protein [Neolewinella maritima]CAH1000900.1 hypothetical protein LEM8419_01941 [Neolewinella maritima]
MPSLLLADLGLFVGRFHPLLVHLPIGFLILAAVLEWWPGDRARAAIGVGWVLGAASAVVAAFCGYLLSGESGGGDTLFWHQWLGFGVATLAVIGVFVSRRGGKVAKGFGVLTVALLGLAGHQGGNLTHGETYLLEHAPPLVQQLSGHAADTTGPVDWSTVNTDSINIYASFLRPALDETCVRCHNAGKQNGGLRMDEARLLFAGGDGGSIVTPGDALGSLWYKRVTLPRSNAKAMPPRGEPLSFTQVRLLEYWIAEGADTLAVFDPKDVPADIKEFLARDYGLDLRPRLFAETITAPALPAQTLQLLADLDWVLTPLLPGGPALEAKPARGATIDPAALATLAELAHDQIAYLSLDRLSFTDADLLPLAAFKNLNRLRLNGTGISSATIERLGELPHLESLNLYDTKVDDTIFAHLQHFPALRRIYLWQTNVSPEAVATFASAHPTIAIDTGFTFGPDTGENSK